MLQNLRLPFVKLFTIISLCSLQFLGNPAHAQRLIYYWNFNSLAIDDTFAAPGCVTLLHPYTTYPSIPDDYSINTNTAQFYFMRQPGVTSAWPYNAVEGICYEFVDFTTGTSTNTFLGAGPGYCIRPRNPVDSMEIRMYAPTTGYQNILISLAAEATGTTVGSYMNFAYSVDSGVTWTNTGCSVTGASVTSSSTFNTSSVFITDPAAYNNPRFVFRIRDSLHTAQSGGNIRLDNIAIQGDTLITPQTLLYFWHFNNLASFLSYTWNNPTFPYIAPDYFIHDSSKAKIHMGLFPGTSLVNPIYFDDVTLTLGAPDYDTVNQNWPGIPALTPVSVVSPTTTCTTGPGCYQQTGIRTRNPQDSGYLYFYIPTGNYKNITLKFATETSSLSNGDSIQLYTYSVDSGATWRQSGITEALDSAWVSGMPTGTIPFRPTPITIQFTDPAANNCSKLIFRIHEHGRSGGGTGNNRFDNISVQGDSIITDIVPMPTITTTPTAYGPFCNSAPNTISVPFTSTGTITGTYYVQITSWLGVFPANVTTNIIGSGTTSPITAVIPSGLQAGTNYRIRVVSADPVIYGSDNGSNITLNGSAGPVTGRMVICAGGVLDTVADAGGGTWSVSNANVSIGSATGYITSNTAGLDTVTYSLAGCTATAVLTINPLPATITGTLNACATGSAGTTLSDATSLGTWTSSNTTVATIGSGTGTVTGLTAGTSTISYTLPTGCAVTTVVTINPLPSAISGTAVACVGLSSTLTDAGGGTWSSSNSGIANIGSASGTVSGISNGVATITYTLPTGCMATTPFTVNPNPGAISGTNACVGVSTPFTDPTAFGAWTSSNTGVATVGSASGIVTGVSVGTATISYTLSTGCLATQAISVNPVPSSISGTAVVCAGSTTNLSNSTSGGTWSSGNIAVATVGSTGTVTGVAAGTATISYVLPTGCIATQVVTVNPLPAPIGGSTSVYCIGSTATLTDATSGGLWTSSNTGVATVGSASGIVTGVAAGSATITYTLPTGCIATLGENITSSPAPITGTATQCVGSSTNLSDLTAFGAWSSSNTAVATIGSGTGVITGVSAGTVTVTYQLSAFCVTTRTLTVNPAPQNISGTASVCAGLTTTLSDTGSGSWSSSIPALATVAPTTGVVTGIAAGNPVITYTAPSGCITTTVFTVNPLPGPIAGTGSVYCIGSTSTLVDGTSGGTWTSGNTAVATIGSSSGIVTGVSAGSAVITYTLPTGCVNTITENISSTPAPITGVTGACAGNNATYSDVTAFGAWSSSNTAIAIIGSGTGILTGVAAGTATITYQLSPICLITKNITVNPLPSAISGTPQVCPGTTTTLSDAGGGSWASSIPALASVDLATGVVTGNVAGTVTITYTLPTGCITTTPVTVNPSPSIVGPSNICVGLPTTLLGSIGSGTWVSSNTAVATIGSISGSVTGVTVGSATITYTDPAGCTATSPITVSPPPSPISGTSSVCAGLTTTLTDAGGGGWYSSNPSVATIGFGTGTVTGIAAGTVTITYTLGTTCISAMPLTVNPLPATITGTMVVCPGVTSTLSDVTTGGTWTSSNTALATVGSGSGVVTGVAGGTSAITYTLPTGCIKTAVVTVNPVSPITGTMNVCSGSTTALSDTLTGGTWISSSTAFATVGSSSGVVTGVASGTPTITYTLSTGCITTSIITVNAIPASITGITHVCEGDSITLADATSGGMWSTSDPSTATVGSASGSVFGVSNGSCTISYALPTGCLATTSFVVNPLPSSILGSLVSCAGTPDTLTDVPTGGSWSSSSTLTATIGSASGVVIGAAGGSVTITYALSTGCIATTSYTVNPLPIIDTVTGGGTYCAGGTGSHVGLSSSDTSDKYQLYNGTTAVGSAISGTGATLDFGAYTVTGTYVIVATDNTTSCSASMHGSAVITINPLPNINTITGGGDYCLGDTGVHVGLGGSDTGILYQLYRGGTTTVGSPLPGIGYPLDFGLQTIPGNYTVVAKNAITACISNMVGTAVVNEDTLYTPVVTITTHPAGGIDYGQTDTLHASVTAGGPGVTYQWVINGTFIAGATSATYVYANTGYANNDSLTCLVTSHSFCGSATSGNYRIIHILNVGVNQVSGGNIDLKLIPNPNNGMFTVKGTLGTTDDEEVTLTITNMLGQQVFRKNVTAITGNVNEQIQLSGALASGMYILDVRSGNENKVFHFVLKQ